MSLSNSMNARKGLNEQKPYPSHAFTHESSKVGRRGKKRGKTEADGKKGSPTKLGKECLTSPSHRMRPLAPEK